MRTLGAGDRRLSRASANFNNLEIWHHCDNVRHMARLFHHPSVKDIKLDSVLRALSDPARRNIIFRLMGCDGMNCGKACDELPPSTISFHYRVLREAGLIRSEKKGVEVINNARKADIEQRFPGLLHTIFQHHKKAKDKK